jgi:hypothetical protein
MGYQMLKVAASKKNKLDSHENGRFTLAARTANQSHVIVLEFESRVYIASKIFQHQLHLSFSFIYAFFIN